MDEDVRSKDGGNRQSMNRLTKAMAFTEVVLAVVGISPAPMGAQEQWRVQESPAVSIGDGTGEGQDLFSVSDAAVAPDGSILILDGGSRSIRVYSRDGAFLRSVGRDGDGPGEYRSLRALRVLRSGEVLVHDPVALRLTRLDKNLEVMGTERIARDVGASVPVPGRLRPLESGTVLMAGGDVAIMDAVRRPDGVHQDDLVFSAHRDGGFRKILRMPRGTTFTVRTGQRGLTQPVPFEERALFASGPSELVVGTSHDTVFRRMTEDGEVAGEFVAYGSPRPATSRDWDHFRDSFLRTWSGTLSIRGIRTDQSPNLEEFLKSTPRGGEFPLFDALMVSEQGQLWVREYSLEGDSVTWQITYMRKGPVGRITLPRAWTIFEATQDYVLVRERDEFDVEIVRKYAIDRRLVRSSPDEKN